MYLLYHYDYTETHHTFKNPGPKVELLRASTKRNDAKST